MACIVFRRGPLWHFCDTARSRIDFSFRWRSRHGGTTAVDCAIGTPVLASRPQTQSRGSGCRLTWIAVIGRVPGLPEPALRQSKAGAQMDIPIPDLRRGLHS